MKSNESEGEILEKELIDYSLINMDSYDALKKAVDLFNLKPSNGWAKGYHFTLRNFGDDIVFTVIGQDINGYFSKNDFNPRTNKFKYGEHKVPLGGNFYEYDGEKEYKLDSIKNSWIVDAKPSPNYLNDKTIIARNVVNPLTDKSTENISITKDDGKKWTRLKFNEGSL